MSLRSFYIIFGVIVCLQQFPVDGSPQLHLRKLYGSANDIRTKKEDLSSTQPDEDVLELEHLKHMTLLENSDGRTHMGTASDGDENSAVGSSIESAFENPINSDDSLPTLEKQLEAEAAKINKNYDDIAGGDSTIKLSGQPEKEEEMIVQHRPPHIPLYAKPQSFQNQQHPSKPTEVKTGNSNNQEHQEIHEMNEKSPSPAKSFYGAARLAFGQNPEVLPTPSTTTTTSSGTIIIPQSTLLSSTTDDTVIVPENVVGLPSSSSSDIYEEETGAVIATVTEENSHQHDNNNKEIIEDPIVAELEATKGNVERRSVDRIPSKTAESLLKHAESSFDMAQYVFWTGDEAGVAHAVEEFIQQGLMSRENALKFLREIRMGIDYLQKSYDNRVLLEQKSNDYKKNEGSDNLKNIHRLQASTSTVPDENNYFQLKEKHLPSQLQQYHHMSLSAQTKTQGENPAVKSNLQKSLDGFPSLMRLQEFAINGGSSERKENINEEDDIAGRARLADFLYTEYTLEEVIYQLAKVMFAQSLAHGSEQSQKALQRLTSFLETEGELGRISPSLQKKVLDVLLAALSDTLANHPELLAAARDNLGKTFHQIKHNSLESMKH